MNFLKVACRKFVKIHTFLTKYTRINPTYISIIAKVINVHRRVCSIFLYISLRTEIIPLHYFLYETNQTLIILFLSLFRPFTF